MDRTCIGSGFFAPLEGSIPVSQESGDRVHLSVDDQEVGHSVVVEVGKRYDQGPFAGPIVVRFAECAVTVPQPDRDGAAHGTSVGDRQIKLSVSVQIGHRDRGGSVAVFVEGAFHKCAVAIPKEHFQFIVA